MQKGKIIFNPFAGRVPPERLVEQAARSLQKRGWDISVEATRSGEHVTELAWQAAEENLAALFVAGGDGSIGRAVAGLSGSRTALGVLPTGTANVFARELGIPRFKFTDPLALARCAALLSDGRPREIDVGYCNGVAFLLWAGSGVDSQVVHRLERKRQRWSRLFAYLEYGLLTSQLLLRWPGQHMRIHSRDLNGSISELEGVYWNIVAANINKYAGGLIDFPCDNAFDDGEMQLWLLSGSGLSRLRSFWNLWRNKNVDMHADITQLSFKSLEIEFGQPSLYHIDGEPAPQASQIDIQVRRRRLQVLTPRT